MMRRLGLIVYILGIFGSGTAHASCEAATGDSTEQVFFSAASNTLLYCGSSNPGWSTISTAGGTALGDRISTTGVANGANLGMVVAQNGTISFTTGGVAGTAYLDTTGRYIGPGVSITTMNGVSSTNGHFSGNVGIGTTSPNNLLTINKATSVANQVFANLTVAGNDVMTLGEDILGNYGGALVLKDGLGGASTAAFRYNAGYPQITTSATTFNIIGTGFRAIFTNAYHNFSFGSTTILTLLSTGIGIGTGTPTQLLSLGGNVARTIWMERHTVADSAGNNLTVQAGGATTGATNKNGGDLILSSGMATGTGSSKIQFKTAATGSTGTVDQAPATVMTIDGSGNVGIGTTSPSTALTVSGTISTTALVVNGVSISLNGGTTAGDRISTTGVASGANLGMVVAQNGTISFTTGGVAGTAYLDTTGRYIGPGVSITTMNGVSSTNGYFSGNVGIGTAAPSSLLHLLKTAAGAIDSKIRLDNLNSTSGTGSSIDFYHDNGGAIQSGRIGFKRSAIGANFGDLFIDVGSNGTFTNILSADVNGFFNVRQLNASAGLFGTITNASNNAVDVVGTLTKMTSGSAASGLGAALAFRGQTTNTNAYDMATIFAVYTTVTAAAQTADLVFSTANAGTIAEKVRILGNGNVGIGTTSPSTALTVSGTISTTALVVNGVAISANGGGATATNRISTTNVASGASLAAVQADVGTVSFTTGGVAGTAYLDTTGRYIGPGVSITTMNGVSSTNGYFSGNVGIGTASPAAALDVRNAYTRIGAGTNQAAYLQSNMTGEMLIGEDAGNVYIYRGFGGGGSKPLVVGSTNTYSAFYTNSNERMRIDSSGNVGIGTTAPTEKLQTGVGGNIFTGGYFRSNMPGTNGAAANVCYSGAGIFDACSSLRKFKTNIRPLRLGLDTVMKLSPVSYDWKASGEHDIGFIAEDTVKVDPVLGEKSTKGELSGVRYGHMTAVLARAIQELKALFDGLKANDAATTARLDQMAAELAALKQDIFTLKSELTALK